MWNWTCFMKHIRYGKAVREGFYPVEIFRFFFWERVFPLNLCLSQDFFFFNGDVPWETVGSRVNMVIFGRDEERERERPSYLTVAVEMKHSWCGRPALQETASPRGKRKTNKGNNWEGERRETESRRKERMRMRVWQEKKARGEVRWLEEADEEWE